MYRLHPISASSSEFGQCNAIDTFARLLTVTDLFLICIAFIKLHGRHVLHCQIITPKRLKHSVSYELVSQNSAHECIPSRASGQPTPDQTPPESRRFNPGIPLERNARNMSERACQSLALPAYQTCESEFKHYCLGQELRVLAYELPLEPGRRCDYHIFSDKFHVEE